MEKGITRRSKMKAVLIFVHDIYEELELWYPKLRLEEAGFSTVVAGPEAKKTYQGKHGYPCVADASFKDMHMKDFQGVFIPGGYAPDKLRREPKVLELTKQFFDQKKLVAFICHGGWVPISAKILKGKKATGTTAIKDDLENAGAQFKDAPVVIDGNIVSSRVVSDLPHLTKAMLAFLETVHKP